MKFIYTLVTLACAVFQATAYPYYPAYGNMDTLSYGSSGSGRGGMVMSRYYNPYYNPRTAEGGMAAFMVRQPEEQAVPSQYYQPDRRRQTPLDVYVPPQQNEVYPYPQQPENPAPAAVATEPTEIAEPTEKAELIPTTSKTIGTELAEPEVPEVEEIEEPAPKPKKVAPKKKPVKKPIQEEDDEEEEQAPKMPTGAFFPMFFGWGGRAGGAPGGPMAVANAYSTGRGGVATSHATAYGAPRPDDRYAFKNN